MPFINVSKPTGSSYTNVAKPTNSNITKVGRPGGVAVLRGGMTMGLLIPLTNAVSRFVGNPWVNVSKPT